MQIKGIGKVKAIQLKALCELGVRMSKPANYKKVIIKEPYDLAKILMSELKKFILQVFIMNPATNIDMQALLTCE